MKELTSFEIRVLEHVKKQKTVALTEDLFDFDGFEKNEFSKIQNTLEELVYKREINRGRTPNNYTVY